jgi:hypothetical protein
MGNRILRIWLIKVPYTSRTLYYSDMYSIWRLPDIDYAIYKVRNKISVRKRRLANARNFLAEVFREKGPLRLTR